jgi:hypothetical protein
MNKNLKQACLYIGIWLFLSSIFLLNPDLRTIDKWYMPLAGGAVIGGAILIIYLIIKDFTNTKHKLKYLIAFIIFVIFKLLIYFGRQH